MGPVEQGPFSNLGLVRARSLKGYEATAFGGSCGSKTGSALLPLSMSVEASDLTKTASKSAVSVLSTQVDLAT